MTLVACDEVEIPANITVPDAESLEMFNSGISFSASKEGGVQSVSLSFVCTVDWSVAIEEMTGDWLSVNPTSGSAGSVTITVSAKDNTDTAPRSAKVTVTCSGLSKSVKVTQAGAEPEPVVVVTSITLDRTEAEMTIGESIYLFPTIIPDDAADKTITWSSSNPKVATVAGKEIPDVTGNPMQVGTVTAVGEGEALITAKAGDKEAYCKIIVKSATVAVSSIELNKTDLEMEPGQTEQLTATVLPDDATDKTVTWSSSNTSIATVDNGLVTAVAVGEALITASAGGKKADCKVTVIAPVVEEVVDMGLSVKWRAWNLGATKPEEIGDYYAWGEVEPYYDYVGFSNTTGMYVDDWKDGKEKGYNWESYIFRISGFYPWDDEDPLKVSKYNNQAKNGTVDNKTVLDPEDDAAHVILGGSWRMPTKEEWQELFDNTNIERTQVNTTIAGKEVLISAIKYISKKNGKSILFVDSGYCINTTCYGRGGYAGYCWSSSLVESDIANGHEWAPSEAWVGYIYGPNQDLGLFSRERIYGLNIRPVTD